MWKSKEKHIWLHVNRPNIEKALQVAISQEKRAPSVFTNHNIHNEDHVIKLPMYIVVQISSK